ncbi:MAG TPA: hypothetical protein VGQ39_01295 [Pyrinomonadaceae bacterium]|nr:hypothetical protein [Pyrinomonadaceae bacterium]
MDKIRIVVADDEPLARRGIRQLLAEHADITVVAEARTGRNSEGIAGTKAGPAVS